MSFEYIIEKENKTVRLSKEHSDDLASSICADFKTYNDGRRENLDKADFLIDEIFFKNRLSEEKDKTKKWKAKVKMCKTFMFYQTLKAFIWKNIYANMNSMFDVSGENQEADNASNKQKAMLVDIFEKMEYQKVADQIIDHSFFYGELISFTAWKKKEEEYRRPIGFFETLFKDDISKLPKILDAAAKGKRYWIDTREIYNNPYIYAVNPANFVFDTTQVDNFDNCPKILKTWKTPNEIINNKLYTVSDKLAKELKDLIKKPDSSEQADQSDDRLLDEVVNGGTIEVLEHWGDITLPDGTILNNWHAVVVAGKHLVRFAKNESTINPFTYGTILKDPKTQRGLSILSSVIELALTQEDLMNRTYNMQALSENPPIYAPKGFFDKDEIELYPGKIIEFDENLTPGQITQMQFAVSVFLQDIGFLSDLMSEASGIFPNMAGADENKAKTATEISTKTQGQMTRLSMLIDTINQYLIIPNVKNVAKLCAGFKQGIEKLFINKDNKKEVIEIDDRVRQADYKYTYSDRTATAERLNKADQIAAAIKDFAQFLPLNARELFTWYMEQKGVENPERFLQDGVQIPQEIQDILVQNPQVQAMIAQLEQMKANGGQVPVGGDYVPAPVDDTGAIAQTPV